MSTALDLWRSAHAVCGAPLREHERPRCHIQAALSAEEVSVTDLFGDLGRSTDALDRTGRRIQFLMPDECNAQLSIRYSRKMIHGMEFLDLRNTFLIDEKDVSKLAACLCSRERRKAP